MFNNQYWEEQLQQAVQYQNGGNFKEAVRCLEDAPNDLAGDLTKRINQLLPQSRQQLAEQQNKLKNAVEAIERRVDASEEDLKQALEALMDVYFDPANEMDVVWLDKQRILNNDDEWPAWRTGMLAVYGRSVLQNPSHTFLDLRGLRSKFDKAISVAPNEDLQDLSNKIKERLEDLRNLGVIIDSRTLTRDYVTLIKKAEARIQDGVLSEVLPNQAGGTQTIVYGEELKTYQREYAQYTLEVAQRNFAEATDNLSINDWLQRPADRKFNPSMSPTTTIKDRLQSALANLIPTMAEQLGIRFEQDRSISPIGNYLVDEEQKLFKVAPQAIESALDLLNETVHRHWNVPRRELSEVYEHVLRFYKHDDVITWVKETQDKEERTIKGDLDRLSGEIETFSELNLEPLNREINDLAQRVENSGAGSPFAPRDVRIIAEGWENTLKTLRREITKIIDRRKTIENFLNEAEEKFEDSTREEIDNRLKHIENLLGNANNYADEQRERASRLRRRYNQNSNENEMFVQLFDSFRSALQHKNVKVWESLGENFADFYKLAAQDRSDEYKRAQALWQCANAQWHLLKSNSIPYNKRTEDGEDYQARVWLVTALDNIQRARMIFPDETLGIDELPTIPGSAEWNVEWDRYVKSFCHVKINEITGYRERVEKNLERFDQLRPLFTRRDQLSAGDTLFDCEFLTFYNEVLRQEKEDQLLLLEDHWFTEWKNLTDQVLNAQAHTFDQIRVVLQSISILDVRGYPPNRRQAQAYRQRYAGSVHNHIIAGYENRDRIITKPFGLVQNVDYQFWLENYPPVADPRVNRDEIEAYNKLAKIQNDHYRADDNNSLQTCADQLERILGNPQATPHHILLDAQLHVIGLVLENIRIQELGEDQQNIWLEKAQKFRDRLQRIANNPSLGYLWELWSHRTVAYESFIKQNYVLTILEFERSLVMGQNNVIWFDHRYAHTEDLQSQIFNLISVNLNADLRNFNPNIADANIILETWVNTLLILRIRKKLGGPRAIGDVDRVHGIVNNPHNLQAVLTVIDQQLANLLVNQLSITGRVALLNQLSELESKLHVIKDEMQKEFGNGNNPGVWMCFNPVLNDFSIRLQRVSQSHNNVKNFLDLYDGAVRELYRLLRDAPPVAGNLWTLDLFEQAIDTTSASLITLYQDANIFDGANQQDCQTLQDYRDRIAQLIGRFRATRREILVLLSPPPQGRVIPANERFRNAHQSFQTIVQVRKDFRSLVMELFDRQVFTQQYERFEFDIPERFLASNIDPQVVIANVAQGDAIQTIRGYNNFDIVLTALDQQFEEWENWNKEIDAKTQQIENLTPGIMWWHNYMKELKIAVFMGADLTDEVWPFHTNLSEFQPTQNHPPVSFDDVPSDLAIINKTQKALLERKENPPQEQPPAHIVNWLRVKYTSPAGQNPVDYKRDQIDGYVNELKNLTGSVSQYHGNYEGYINNYDEAIAGKERARTENLPWFGRAAYLAQINSDIQSFQRNRSKLRGEYEQ